MHFLKDFGYTIEEIEKDGFDIQEKIEGLYDEDSKTNIAMSIGKAVIELTKVFNKIKPDILLLLGDRGEMALLDSVRIDRSGPSPGEPCALIRGAV